MSWPRGIVFGAALFGVLAGCVTPTPAQDQQLSWEKLKREGLPKDTRLAVSISWAPSPLGKPKPGYLTFIDGRDRAQMYRTPARSELGSSPGQLCVAADDDAYRIDELGAQKWRIDPGGNAAHRI